MSFFFNATPPPWHRQRRCTGALLDDLPVRTIPSSPPPLSPTRNVVWCLQAQRKIKSEAYYVEKKGAKQLKEKATAEANLSAVAPVLEQYGF